MQHIPLKLWKEIFFRRISPETNVKYFIISLTRDWSPKHFVTSWRRHIINILGWIGISRDYGTSSSTLKLLFLKPEKKQGYHLLSIWCRFLLIKISLKASITVENNYWSVSRHLRISIKINTKYKSKLHVIWLLYFRTGNTAI